MTQTIIEIYPKADWTAAKVEQARAGHVRRGALSSITVKNNDPPGWRVTTVWPVD